MNIDRANQKSAVRTDTLSRFFVLIVGDQHGIMITGRVKKSSDFPPDFFTYFDFRVLLVAKKVALPSLDEFSS